MPDAGSEGVLQLDVEAKKFSLNNGLRAKPRAQLGPPPEPHARMRKRVLDKIEWGNRLAAALPWSFAAVLAVICGLTAISYRTDIVRAWPKSASVFAMIGQRANLYGIDITGVQARSGVDVKGPRVIVSGVLASASRKPEPVAYLKVALVDAKGIEKLSWMVDPGVTVLRPGARQRFETTRTNPVRGDLKAVVTFAEPPPKAPRPPPLPPEPPTGATGLMGAQSGLVAANEPAPTSRGQTPLPQTAPQAVTAR
jgi:hypothetical protein